MPNAPDLSLYPSGLNEDERAQIDEMLINITNANTDALSSAVDNMQFNNMDQVSSMVISSTVKLFSYCFLLLASFSTQDRKYHSIASHAGSCKKDKLPGRQLSSRSTARVCHSGFWGQVIEIDPLQFLTRTLFSYNKARPSCTPSRPTSSATSCCPRPWTWKAGLRPCSCSRTWPRVSTTSKCQTPTSWSRS